MNLRYLKTFVAVADHGNFARAANSVGLTQSAVSMQMRTLENLLRVRLFDRSKRPAVLSEQGEILVKRAREIVSRFQGLIDDTGGEDNLPAALRLGAVRSSMSGLLPRALAALNHEFPGVRINVTGGLPSDLITRVQDGDLDGVLVSEPQYRAPHLHWIPLVEEPLVVVTAMDNNGHSVEEILTSCPYIGLNRGAWGGRLVDEYLHSRGIVLRPIMEFDSIEPVMLMVQRGIGVSIVHQGCIDHPLRVMMRRFTLEEPALARRVGLLYRTNVMTVRLFSQLALELKRCSAEQREIWWPLREETSAPPGAVASVPTLIRKKSSRSARR